MLESWTAVVPLMQAGYHQELKVRTDALRATETIYPPSEQVFAALELTPFDAVKVVLVGQDPYHGTGQAHGLAFSVPEEVRIPPSLRNIFKEIAQDVSGDAPPTLSGDLTRWARQGVLLLNAALTVAAGQAASHKSLGWHRLTDQIIETLSREREHLVFLLWGRHAQSKAAMVDDARHLVLEAPHPSPLSARRGFFGCRHFSRANTYLAAHGKTPIVW